MRIALILVALSLPFLAACSSSHDRDTEEVGEPILIEQGGSLEGEVRSDDSYPSLNFYRYEEDVDNLPFGFDYDTEEVFLDEWDRLWVEYDLDIATSVAPGNYYFTATYDLYDTNSIFREEVEFRFYVQVVDEFQTVKIQGQVGLAPEDRGNGGDTELLIE